MTSVFTAEDRKRIDKFHADYAKRQSGSSTAERADPNDGFQAEIYCGAPGCAAKLERGEGAACGACRCAYYCGPECQREGWKAGGHKAACKLLAAARALPPPPSDRSYVVQLKLVGARGLRGWAADLEAAAAGGEDVAGGADLAGMHREMAAALQPRERALFALEARHHALLRFEIIPPSKRLQPSDLALFALKAVLQPMSDLPTLGMSREAPRRPYALWLPGSGPERPMAEPVGRLLAGAGLATSAWYVGGGFCAESFLGGDGQDELALDLRTELDVDYYTEDDSDAEDAEDEKDSGVGEQQARAAAAAAAGAPARGPAAAAAPAAGGRLRVLVVAGMHMFGPVGEAEDPLLGAVAGALRASAGAELVVAMFPRRKPAAALRAAEQQLAEQLRGGGFGACVVLGLGSGDDFKPRTPTQPWSDGGPWKEGLAEWVRGGGVLVMHGERAAGATARAYFGLSWSMEGNWYLRTDHVLNPRCPLLAGGGLAGRLPRSYNVKACTLGDVPEPQRVFATAVGARTHSLVPSMAGGPVEEGRCAMAAAAVGSGAVVFFGDVNWEEPTLEAVAALVKQLAAERGAAGGGGGSRGA